MRNLTGGSIHAGNPISLSSLKPYQISLRSPNHRSARELTEPFKLALQRFTLALA
jgi:hypothetical protein